MKNKTKTMRGALIGVAVISAFTFSSIGYGEEPVRDYYANGQLKSEKNFKDGKLEGTLKT